MGKVFGRLVKMRQTKVIKVYEFEVPEFMEKLGFKGGDLYYVRVDDDKVFVKVEARI